MCHKRMKENLPNESSVLGALPVIFCSEGRLGRIEMKKNSIHETAIDLLQRSFSGSQRALFRRSIQKLQWDWEGRDEFNDKPTWKEFLENAECWKSGILPDLYFIDEEVMSVVCIEVENTNKIDDSKLNSYRGLWWHLDHMNHELHILCSDSGAI